MVFIKSGMLPIVSHLRKRWHNSLFNYFSIVIFSMKKLLPFPKRGAWWKCKMSSRTSEPFTPSVTITITWCIRLKSPWHCIICGMLTSISLEKGFVPLDILHFLLSLKRALKFNSYAIFSWNSNSRLLPLIFRIFYCRVGMFCSNVIQITRYISKLYQLAIFKEWKWTHSNNKKLLSSSPSAPACICQQNKFDWNCSYWFNDLFLRV